jgi:hypothetical protein
MPAADAGSSPQGAVDDSGFLVCKFILDGPLWGAPKIYRKSPEVGGIDLPCS